MLPPEDSATQDGGSRETALLVYARLQELTGRAPHLTINHVTRNRLNLNRDDARPNADVPEAIAAWEEFHGYVEDSKDWVTTSCGRGHYFDFHTNGHDTGWVEVGTALTVERLALPDDELEAEADQSSYWALASRPEISFAEILRGPTSLGGLLEAEGIGVVPSPMNPGPGRNAFFTGGYNVRRHGSRDDGVIDGSQLEMHFNYINAGSEAREAFAITLTDAMVTFMETHYGFDLDAP